MITEDIVEQGHMLINTIPYSEKAGIIGNQIPVVYFFESYLMNNYLEFLN